MSALLEHLQLKVTHLCRCWAVIRRDGRVFGFTDHDQPLSFEGITFRADTGMTALALEQVTGLAVDNTEAVGALSDISVTEADITAGRFDGARIQAWQVCWDDVNIRELQFSGTIGELKRADGAFHAELRGLSEALNQPSGQIYQQDCRAILGDSACGIDLEAPQYRREAAVLAVENNRVFRFNPLASQFEERWFEKGRLEMMSGAGEGLSAVVKNDRFADGQRVVELWEELRAEIAVGDLALLEVGCDKRKESCRAKFGNMINFRGFPHIPGEDWLMSYPTSSGQNDGGSQTQ